MSEMRTILSRIFKLSFKRKPKRAGDNPYPLSLTTAEMAQLKELLRSPGWVAYRNLLERYADLRAQRLLQPLPPDATNVERGAILALFEIAALPDQLLKHLGDEHARTKRADGNDAANATTDFYWQWGSEYFRDRFRHP